MEAVCWAAREALDLIEKTSEVKYDVTYARKLLRKGAIPGRFRWRDLLAKRAGKESPDSGRRSKP